MQTRVAAARKNSGKVVRKVDRAQRARGLHGFVIGDKNREIAMGCALSSPVELIRVQRHGHAAFRCAVAEMQGWRVGHEDAHAMRCDASSATCFVLDGHGGDGAALFAAPELLEEVSKREKAPDVPSDAHLEEAFSTVDKRLRGYFQEHAEKDSGTTVVGAVCAKTKDGSYKVKLLNCGDSRAVVVRNPKEEASPEPLIRRPGHIEALGTKGNPVKGEAQVAAPTGKPLVVVETVDHKHLGTADVDEVSSKFLHQLIFSYQQVEPGSADTRCIKVSRAAMNCVVSHGVCCVRSFCPEYHSRALAPSSSRMADSGSGTGRGTAAASVGGSRTALARRTNTRTGAGAGANSGKKAGGGGGGILKFYSDDTPGLKVGPTTVLVLSLVFMAIVCSLHILGKFRSG
eukprot:s1032_g13.t2